MIRGYLNPGGHNHRAAPHVVAALRPAGSTDYEVVDFLIATEGEMKKVNWSTRREILGSTWVVIGLTFVVALIIGVLDLTYSSFFSWVNVLDTTPG